MTQPADERNIEIKARVGSDSEFETKVNIAKKLTASEGELLIQKDIFFNSETGRLKLRHTENAKAQLVYYDRPDIAGPKLSKFNKITIDEPEILEKILTASNGARGILKKHRYLFMYKNTRIHMDKVEDLGNFMEFEVCLKPEQTIEEGQAFAEELMKLFGIKEDDLMTGAYFDVKK
ncbi:uncharacterized protein LOC129910416 [Episyrphus balteatus]|uniref:uncharacterized protein LOC129910416 n=1 Tax=Episyrphus balteatus TaxID=286459 RepID=UPI002486991E|nr:uncharacterized protein LOC129910416 [Episyrphus balteatus]